MQGLHKICVFINDDIRPRKEDKLIAYGWRRFLKAGGGEENVEYLARFPMTKAIAKPDRLDQANHCGPIRKDLMNAHHSCA